MYGMYPINAVDIAFLICLHCIFLDKISTFCFLCLQYVITNVLQKCGLRKNYEGKKIKGFPMTNADF